MATRIIGGNTAYALGQSPLEQMYSLPIIANRAPTTADRAELGTIWVFKSSNIWYILTSVVANVATWTSVTAPGGAITGTSLNISGAVTFGGIGQGVMQTNGAGVVSSSIGANGQLLIGSDGTNPIWASLTSTGGTIAITPGAGTLNIDASGEGIPWTSSAAAAINAVADNAYLVTNVAAVVTLPATPSLGDIVMVAQGSASGSTVTVTANAGDTIALEGVRTAGGGSVISTTIATGPRDQVDVIIKLRALSASAWTVESYNGDFKIL